MTTLSMTSVNSLLCHASTCLRIGSKFRCIRSTPTEMQSMSENDFECFASTGVNTPGTMLPNWRGPTPHRFQLSNQVERFRVRVIRPESAAGANERSHNGTSGESGIFQLSD